MPSAENALNVRTVDDLAALIDEVDQNGDFVRSDEEVGALILAVSRKLPNLPLPADLRELIAETGGNVEPQATAKLQARLRSFTQKLRRDDFDGVRPAFDQLLGQSPKNRAPKANDVAPENSISANPLGLFALRNGGNVSGPPDEKP